MPDGAGKADQPRYFTPLRVLALLVCAATLYALAPKLLDVFAEAPNLRSLGWFWFLAMLAAEGASFVCMWWLIRIALPDIDWFTAGTAQLSGAAVTKAVPGGAPMGAALQFRMLAVSGVRSGTAGSTMAATSIISTGTLFALPMIALMLAFFGAPIPQGLSLVAWGGGLMFLLLMAMGTVIVTTDRPLVVVGGFIERWSERIASRFGHHSRFTVERLMDERDRVTTTLGERWGRALAAASGNWLLDYMALVAALQAVGSEPRISLVLLAYGTAAVLTMIPVTPGGLGFVEAGLTGTLTLAGIPATDALLATLAYRLVSYWLPIPLGVAAYLLFRRRFGVPPSEREARAMRGGEPDPDPDPTGQA